MSRNGALVGARRRRLLLLLSALILLILPFVLTAPGSFAAEDSNAVVSGTGKSREDPALKRVGAVSYTGRLSSCAALVGTGARIEARLDADSPLGPIERSEPLVNGGEVLSPQVWAVGSADIETGGYAVRIEIPTEALAPGRAWGVFELHSFTLSAADARAPECDRTFWVGLIPALEDPQSGAEDPQSGAEDPQSGAEEPQSDAGGVAGSDSQGLPPAANDASDPVSGAIVPPAEPAPTPQAADPEAEGSGEETPIRSGGRALVAPSTGFERWTDPADPLSVQAAEARLSEPAQELADEAAHGRLAKNGILAAHAAVTRGDLAWESVSALSGIVLGAASLLILLAGGVTSHLLSASAPGAH